MAGQSHGSEKHRKRGLQGEQDASSVRFRESEREPGGGAGHLNCDQGPVVDCGRIGLRMHLLQGIADQPGILKSVFDIESSQFDRCGDATPNFDEGRIRGLQFGHPIDDHSNQVICIIFAVPDGVGESQSLRSPKLRKCSVSTFRARSPASSGNIGKPRRSASLLRGRSRAWTRFHIRAPRTSGELPPIQFQSEPDCVPDAVSVLLASSSEHQTSFPHMIGTECAIPYLSTDSQLRLRSACCALPCEQRNCIPRECGSPAFVQNQRIAHIDHTSAVQTA